MDYKNKVSVVVKWYRFENWLFTHRLKVCAQLIYHLIQIVFGCTIPYSVQIGDNLEIAHFHGIVMHHKSVIGNNCTIYQNVCLGGRNGKGGPTIGDNVVIGAGACILGEIKIGNNVNIGANAVVLTDIPDNCTVVGVPGKIIYNEAAGEKI